MDSDKIITTVVASLITALVIFAGSRVFGFFEVHVERSEIPAIARAFVDDDDSLSALMNAMAASGEFVGPRGPEGPQGPRGVQGPPIDMQFQRFDLYTPRDNPQSMSQGLGEQQFCTLTSHRHAHASQACSCRVRTSGGQWVLDMTVDESASGSCGCEALCSNW